MWGGCGEDWGRSWRGKVCVAIGVGDSMIVESDSRVRGAGESGVVSGLWCVSGEGCKVVRCRVMGMYLRSDSGDRKKV